MYLLCTKRFYVVSNIRITIIFNFLLDELIFFHIVRCLLIFDPRNYLIFLAMQGSVKILNIQYILNVLFSFKYISGSIIENSIQTNLYFFKQISMYLIGQENVSLKSNNTVFPICFMAFIASKLLFSCLKI